MFTQLRRAVARSIPHKTLTKRKFGGHGEHHVEYMSTHSELPAGDWRNKPMTWNFNRKPTSDYESFVHSHLSGPNDPALNLTKGQFIVYMRRLHREEFGYKMYMQRVWMAWILFGVVYTTNYSWRNAHNPVETTLAQRQFSSIFDAAPIQGPNFVTGQDFRFRLDEFFADHDEATIEKLPQQLKELYYEKKESYNEEYSSTPQLVQVSENLSPSAILEAKKSLMVKFGLSEAEIIKIYQNCDMYALHQQMYDLDEDAMAAKFPKLAQGTTIGEALSLEIANKDGAVEQLLEEGLKKVSSAIPVPNSKLLALTLNAEIQGSDLETYLKRVNNRPHPFVRDCFAL